MTFHNCWQLTYPDNKVHGANMRPIWGRQDPGGPHVGLMNFAIWVVLFINDSIWSLICTIWYLFWLGNVWKWGLFANAVHMAAKKWPKVTDCIYPIMLRNFGAWLLSNIKHRAGYRIDFGACDFGVGPVHLYFASKSLAPGTCGCNRKWVISKLIFRTYTLVISWGKAHRWVTQHWIR